MSEHHCKVVWNFTLSIRTAGWPRSIRRGKKEREGEKRCLSESAGSRLGGGKTALNIISIGLFFCFLDSVVGAN